MHKNKIIEEQTITINKLEYENQFQAEELKTYEVTLGEKIDLWTYGKYNEAERIANIIKNKIKK